ncbi:histidine kinase [uncultured Draconibacterium sp.]|uniref:sensor histidine kinase n=1 Tax=uncultured Draconibacterium sp. TaxID=1573823 RepID=UPI00321686AD
MIKIKRKIWVPLVAWAALFLFIFNTTNFFHGTKFALINATYETIVSCLMYYITYLFLFPRFHKKGRKYFLISSLTIIILAVIFLSIDQYLLTEYRIAGENKPPEFFHFFRYFFSLGFVFFVATSISLMNQTTQLQANEKLLTEEKLQTELKLLKAQINPHFIFNALNNIYSLTYMQSKNAPESVLKLSEMLRYVFYDCNKDRVPVSAELTYIENFTAFQQMKSEYIQNIRIKTDINGGTVEIAPMLFIPFIENAFKYSRIEENENAFVRIDIKSRDNKLHFQIENSFQANLKPAPGSGMGIKNVRHRLDIIYPNQYELKIDEQDELFSVNLKLNI